MAAGVLVRQEVLRCFVYENLFTVDDQGSPIRQLADSWKVGQDGLTYTVTLRKGVLFHNGKEMKAEDVKASFDHFKRIGVRRGEFASLKQIDVTDDYTVGFHLTEPVAAFIDMLAYPMAPPAIMPRSIAETAEGGKAEIVGTGPYKMIEWVADKHVKLVGFDGYKPDPRYQKPMGFGGKRTAYLDEIYFPLIEEVGAREGALISGEVQGVISISPPSAKNLSRLKDLNMVEINPAGKSFIMGCAQTSDDEFEREIPRSRESFVGYPIFDRFFFVGWALHLPFLARLAPHHVLLGATEDLSNRWVCSFP